MSTAAVLLLGLVFGLRHALEADHLAAVATLVARERGLAACVRHGVAWGIGHTLTLLAFGGTVLVLGSAVSAQAAQWLEALVGAMLVALGLDLLRRLAQDRVHFHRHRHDGGVEHFHAHSHRRERGTHDPARHRHEHRPLPWRALLVGMVHGLAGSAALVLLALQQLPSPPLAVLYIALFGLGSIAGMAILSAAVSVPLRATAARLGVLHHGLLGSMALVSIGLGVHVMVARL